MLTIYHPDGRRKHSIEDSMFRCVTGQELLQQHPECDSKGWSFRVYPYRIIFSKGNTKEIKYSLINAEGIKFNIGKIKKAWYLQYCESYGYIVIENYMTKSYKSKIILG